MKRTLLLTLAILLAARAPLPAQTNLPSVCTYLLVGESVNDGLSTMANMAGIRETVIQLATVKRMGSS